MLKLREDAIAWREVDGETLLLDLATSKYLSINPSATVLWRLLAEGTTREALVTALDAEYRIGAEQASEDVDAFLEDCLARGLVAELPG
ncbi:MAG TPA: PqqD family protein [Acidimicrobiales bacterium]|nr:PqqD family protein [Acidimicrobiales bacterium]